MAHQAGIRTLDGSETGGRFGVGNVIDLVRPRLEQKRIHDARHVARDTAASFARGGVARMTFGLGLKLSMATKTHPVGIGAEFQRYRIVRRIGRMRVVTIAAGRAAAAETGRANE